MNKSDPTTEVIAGLLVGGACAQIAVGEGLRLGDLESASRVRLLRRRVRRHGHPRWLSEGMDMCAEFLRKRKLPHQLRRNSSSVFDPAHDSIKVMTLHVSKGLEFPVVALVGAGRMPADGEDEREEARLFYVGATRATQRLVIGASGGGKFAGRLLAKDKICAIEGMRVGCQFLF